MFESRKPGGLICRFEFTTADRRLADFIARGAKKSGRSESAFLRQAAIEASEKILKQPRPGK